MSTSANGTGTAPLLARSVRDLREIIAQWRKDGASVGLVPTMGALHQGHMALVRVIQEKVDRTIVSIFVNPKQFGVDEDLDDYPRPLEDDLAQLASVKVDAAFVPEAEMIYPAGFSTIVSVSGLTNFMCGKERPGHFEGVATIVTKLLLQALPDAAIFGEKDYQQLLIIRQLVSDLDIPVEIYSAPIERESDGLAISSRNRYLSASDRRLAPALYATLQSIAKDAVENFNYRSLESRGIEALLEAGFEDVDYFEFRDAETLELALRSDQAKRLFAAAFIGGKRLIDNVAL